MKRVLVTGGSGFVGGRLVRRLLAEGMDPVVLRRADTDLRDASAVFEAVRRARPSTGSGRRGRTGRSRASARRTAAGRTG